MGILLNIAVSAVATLATAWGAYNFLPLGTFETLSVRSGEQRFGAVITTIAGTDTLRSSRTTINDNFTSLNNYKIENSTTSVAAITTLANLVSIGTITTGTWNATILTASYGGTGSSTLSANRVLLGNGTGAIAVVNGEGASGQTLQSQGAGANPRWADNTTDQNANYVWKGQHSFNNPTTTINNAQLFVLNTTTTINGINLQISGSQPATNTFPLITNGQGTVSFVQRDLERVASTSLAVATATSTSGNVPARKAYVGHIHVPVRLSGQLRLRFNANGEARYGSSLSIDNGAVADEANGNGCTLDSGDDTTAMDWWIDVWAMSPQIWGVRGRGTELAAAAGAPNMADLSCQFNATSSPLSSFELMQTSSAGNLPIGTTQTWWASLE